MKFVIVNSSILGGLALQYLRGEPLGIIAMAALFLFVGANLLIVFKAKKRGPNV